MYFHGNTLRQTQTHFSYFWQITGDNWSWENDTCLPSFPKVTEICLCTGLSVCVKEEMKKERNNRTKNETKKDYPLSALWPPTHTLLSVWRWRIPGPLPPQRPYSHSRTLPAQKQQITVLQTTVQKAGQLAELKVTADIISNHTDDTMALIRCFLWTQSCSAWITNSNFFQSARIRRQHPRWRSLSHFYG